MSEPENAPQSARADVAHEAIERLKKRCGLGPDDQAALDTAIKAIVGEAVEVERAKYVAELASRAASARSAATAHGSNVQALELVIAVRKWQQTHLTPLHQGILQIADAVVAPIQQKLDFNVILKRLAEVASRTDATEPVLLDALRQEVFRMLTECQPFAAAQPVSVELLEHRGAVIKAVGALLDVLVPEPAAPSAASASQD